MKLADYAAALLILLCLLMLIRNEGKLRILRRDNIANQGVPGGLKKSEAEQVRIDFWLPRAEWNRCIWLVFIGGIAVLWWFAERYDPLK